jgi:hypothetical protein
VVIPTAKLRIPGHRVRATRLPGWNSGGGRGQEHSLDSSRHVIADLRDRRWWNGSAEVRDSGGSAEGARP